MTDPEPYSCTRKTEASTLQYWSAAMLTSAPPNFRFASADALATFYWIDGGIGYAVIRLNFT